MKDMTDEELLEAIDRAMKVVSDRFRAEREAEAKAAAERERTRSVPGDGHL